MSNKERFFLDDTLTASQLKELRKEIDATPDETIEQRMWQQWNSEEAEQDTSKSGRLSEIWQLIERHIQAERAFSWHKAWRYVQVAAVIMLPILLFSTFYFYRENALFSTDKTIISTADGERASITLPDGSKVTLNERTSLAYDSKSFNKSIRQIEFEGEAYFDVAKDPEHPFTIDSDGLGIHVLGTKFNLNAREASPTSELILEEGSVRFSALKKDKSVTLSPQQKAVLDKATGDITVTEMENALSDATAWKRKELVFRNVPLHQVLKSIEKHYGVTCNVRGNINLNDCFTGIIPANNINDVLQIIETSYHCNTTLKDNRVELQ